jgi:RND family efflux transporter MFP subunit
MEQARYEAPSMRRQAELEKQKAERAMEQAKKDYVTRENQARAKMREVSADVDRNKMYVDMIAMVSSQLSIRAPSAGMVIYLKEYNGKKKGVGAMVYPHPGGGVATLPDLSRMQTICYVNEVDVRRVVVGQVVRVTFDSDPTKKLTGKVVGVANVGEERPNSDAKVFEVKIEIAESDTTLRPGMTTAAAIETAHLTDVLSVPLEAVTSEANVPFVFVRGARGVVKQEVATGEMNDTHIVITAGLEEGDAVLLVPPLDQSGLDVRRLTTSPKPATGDSAQPTTVPVTKTDTGAAGRGGRK